MRICFAGGFGHYDHAADTKEEIVGVLCTDEDTADYREFCKDKKKYTDFVTMLESEKPDAVVIDSIFDEHFEMTKYCLENKIPAFCEKPVCLKSEQVAVLRECAERTGTLLFGMFTTRFEAPFYTAHKLVKDGLIGDVKLISGQKTYVLGKREPFYYDEKRFGNTFSWVGIHSIEQALWISGKKLTGSHYYSRRSDKVSLDDRAVCICELEDCLASFSVDYMRPENTGAHGDDRLRIVGDKGIIEVMDNNVYLTCEGKNREALPLITPPQKIFDNFLAAVKGEVTGLCTTEDTLAATEAVLKISSL